MRPALFATVALLAGCTWLGDGDPMETEGPALAAVIAELPAVDIDAVTVAKPSRQDVVEAYRRVYGAVPDPRTNQAVGKRLADLEMRIGEERDIAGAEAPYRDAIELYESLLAAGTFEDTDEVLYQLARAHDVVGETEAARGYLDRLLRDHPDSAHAPEAHFRRAEMQFSAGEWRGAAADYAHVVDLGADTPYWQNAAYMLGWCLFKDGALRDALARFHEVVDASLADSRLDALPAGERELVEDTLRVMVLAVTYLDGPETLAAHMDRAGKPDWQSLAYERLAESYRDDERYHDAVAALETFVTRNPLDPRAPALNIRLIEVLVAADFPSQVRPAKARFIERYGVFSRFWDSHDPAVRAGYVDTLETYLTELARVAHARAQASGAGADYLAAALWYEQLVATFPNDPRVAEHLFLLGEVYTEAGADAKAVAAYQRVVRDFPADRRAGEAGYAAVLGLTALIEASEGDAREQWRRQRIDAQIEFAMLFPGDPRAPAVAADAADTLFELAEYREAVALADHLLRSRPALDPALARTALLVVGHGRFELGQFAAAETAYRRYLAMPADASSAEVEEKLLAAIYKQAELAEGEGLADVAVGHYLRIGELAPGAALAAKGHYDAVAVLEGAGRVGEAAGLLEAFRTRYGDHPLARGTARRLAGMYEATGRTADAAGEYARVAAGDGDVEVRRLALYRAGELYRRAGDAHAAIEAFDAYAHTYRTPVDLRLEAMQQLDELTAETGDASRRRYWLEQKVALHAAMGADASERATVLAAEAAFELAARDRAAFESVRLSHPLAESLARKTEALERVVAAYQQVAAYGVQELATAATFQIADVYVSLARDLLDSDRPQGLSELELAQYEILLEEQAFPFEEQAISIHQINVRRSWAGVYDEWVEKSFQALSVLVPARFDKQEMGVAYAEIIY